MFEPARTAVIPNITCGPEEQLVGNGLSSTTWSFTLAVGSGLGNYAKVIGIVFDMFTNMEEFLRCGPKAGGVLRLMGTFYSYRLILFFERTEGLLMLVAAMFTVTWIQRYNELTALMSAGISRVRVGTASGRRWEGRHRHGPILCQSLRYAPEMGAGCIWAGEDDPLAVGRNCDRQWASLQEQCNTNYEWRNGSLAMTSPPRMAHNEMVVERPLRLTASVQEGGVQSN